MDKKLLRNMIVNVISFICVICIIMGSYVAPSFAMQAEDGILYAENTEEDEDVNAPAEEKVVRIGYYSDNEAFQSGQSDSVRKYGYAYEYYQEVARYAGWTYEYVYGSWDEIYKKLLNGEVDIMAGIGKNKEREGQMLFPDRPMGVEHYYIFVPSDEEDEAIGNPKKLNKKKVGVKSKSIMESLIKKFAEENNIDIEVVSYETLDARLADLESGKIDYIATVENDGMEGYTAVFDIGYSDFYFAVNKDRPDILEELNKALGDIADDYPYYIARLQDKYFNRGVVQKEKDERDIEWLEKHPEIKIGYLNDYMPFCDSDDDSDMPKGMLFDVMKELKNYTETEFSYKSFDRYEDMLQALYSGEVDIIFPTISDLWYSESQNYIQTIDVVTTRMSVVYKDNYTDDVYDKIAVSEGSPLQSFYITMNYPDSEKCVYEDWDKCIEAIESGEAGCMLINSDLIYRYMNENRDVTLNVAEIDDTIELSFAVRKSDNLLCMILNKGINNIDQTTINDAVIRSSYVEQKYTIKDFIVNNLAVVFTLVFAVILLIIFFFIIYTLRVRKDRAVIQEAYDREKEYIQAKEETFKIIGCLSQIYERTYYIDLLEKTYEIMTDLSVTEESRRSIEEAHKGIVEWIEKDVKEPHREGLLKFIDFGTIADRLAQTESITTEYELESGSWHRCSFISVDRNEKGKLIHVLFAIQEISEEKKFREQTQTALEDAYEAANRANHAKSDFLARMSHDIRTPMNAIIGMTTIAAAHINEPQRISDCLRKITASGRHLLTLINEVLDMGKIEAGKLDMAEEDFDIQELVENMVLMMQPQMDARHHDFKLEIENLEHENVVGDSMHLQQMFVNIISNSIKYTPEGGFISLHINERATNKPKIACFEFIFEDNGIGMSEEFIQRIYEPFAREDETKYNKIQGTGLGLTIVYNIIKMMGGDIKVESRRGEGTKFTVTIYLRIQNNQDAGFGELTDLPVLVVDDDKDSCEATCMVLDDLGMKSEWVLSGREAVNKLSADNAHDWFAVIIELKMLDIDGIVTARMIKEKMGDKAPLIILSGDDLSGSEDEAREAGVDDFINRPLFKSRLKYLFKRYINNASDGGNSLDSLDPDEFKEKRILLAEDNDINAEITTEILNAVGITVEHVWDGKEALDTILSKPVGYYDLVFMDIQMPVMDGHESTRNIRASGREDLKVIPIIALTANAFSEDVRAAKRAGMNQHIAKPIDIKQIIDALRNWL